MDNLGDTIFLAKWLIFNTRRDQIESGDWSEFFKTAMGLSGIYLGFKAIVGPNPQTDPRGTVMSRLQNDYRFREFIWNLVLQAKPYLQAALARHDGLIPFPVLDHVIDQLPTGIFGDLSNDNVKDVMRPVFRKLLTSSTQLGFDQTVMDSIFSLVDDEVKNLGLLDRFYEKTGLNMQSASVNAMNVALAQFAAGLTNADDQARFAKVKLSVLNYQPMLDQDNGFIRFEYNNGYSRSQALMTVSFDLIVNLLFRAYGTGANTTFVQADFEGLFTDFGQFLTAAKIVDPTVISAYPQKRFQDLSLFTPVSDGSLNVSIRQITYYAMIIISSSNLSAKMRREITLACDSGGLPKDGMGWQLIPANCFRSQFNQRLDYWISYFPHLKQYWDTLTPTEQAQALKWLEHGARRNGYNDDPFGAFDFGAMATVLHYTETLFIRFDEDRDQDLDKSEIAEAYPVFKRLLGTKTPVGKKSDYILKGLFSYIVKYRTMPDLNFQLAGWLIIYELPTTHYDADRLSVFNIVCQLAGPDSDSQKALTPTICAP